MDSAQKRKPAFLPGTLKFLRSHFGLKVSFDDPELKTLKIEARSIDGKDLEKALSFYEEAILRELQYERQRNLQVCVGGPMNGKRHNAFCRREVLRFKLGKARWAVYVVGSGDGRAFFRGYATSERNARRLKLLPAEQKR